LLTPGKRRLLGITGPPGAGKSTLAARIVEALAPDAALIGMDGFHLANSELERRGLRGRKGAPETFDVGGFVALLRRLRAADEEVVYAPVFDRSLEESIGSALPVPRAVGLVVTEGNYLLLQDDGWAQVGPLLDESWYVDLDEPTRLRRLVARHVAYGKTPQEAAAWATGTDAENAALVLTSRGVATRIVGGHWQPVL
jgi:pantothenate kinase